ncbi:sirohydrochlorin chelatase [Stieleria varia]|nr:sirohydrochlorin chelatase [Stieleria varia]
MAEPAPAGVMLIGHGTRDTEGTEQFFQLACQLDAVLGRRDVPLPLAACLLEFQEPTISQAWDALVARGVKHIHVAPLLLFAAGHARDDIPKALATCQQRNPDVTWDQAGPISRHGAILDLLERRIGEVTGRLDGLELDRTALVMVGRGSFHPCAQADMRVLTEVLARRMNFAVHRTAFYAMAEPKLPEVLSAVATDDITDVIVQPHLLFQGRLFDAIAEQVAEAGQRYRGVRFHVAGYLGPERAIAQAIHDRVLCTLGFLA